MPGVLYQISRSARFSKRKNMRRFWCKLAYDAYWSTMLKMHVLIYSACCLGYYWKDNEPVITSA